MMNRNYKPHVALVALLILALIISFVCNSCAIETEAATNYNRFTKEYVGNDLYIITDNETGIQYMAYVELTNRGGGVGLTKLEEE
jgi:hypothetical protein